MVKQNDKIEEIIEPYIIAADRSDPRDKRAKETLYAMMDRYNIDEDYDMIRYNIYDRRAKAGDTQAMVELAGYFLREENKQLQRAYDLLYTAAAAGNADAMVKMSLCYSFDDLFGKNPDLSFKWLLSAATKGYSKAMYGVASAYFIGEAVEQNIYQAKAWAEEGARLGSAQCLRFLGKFIYGNINRPFYNLEAAVNALETDMRMGYESEYELAALELGRIFGNCELYGTPRNQFSNSKKAAYCFVLNYIVDSSADDSTWETIRKLNYNVTQNDFDRWKADAMALRYCPESL